ncbi:MAG: DUF1566 domain-containing protein [Proteobacteria bacterium]|nr:DUF1566 domain-containing protein [Pseudomonadota bacterium]
MDGFEAAIAGVALLAAAAFLGCSHDRKPSGAEDGGGTDTDTDIDTDTDGDSDTDPDAGPDECGDVVFEGTAAITNTTSVALLAGVTRITGDLVMNGSQLPNLNGLESLICVDGSVLITNNDNLVPSSSLDGLCNLNRISGAFRVEYNEGEGGEALTRIGLSALRRVEGGVVFDGNALASINGLENLELISGGGLAFTGNQPLSDVDGLIGVETIEGGLTIQNEYELQNLSGLANLADFSGSLKLDGTKKLTDISALAGITHVVELRILNNDVMVSLHGLESITGTDDKIEIMLNDKLSDLNGLGGLLQTPGLFIRENSELHSIQGLANLAAVTDPESGLSIWGNPALASLSGLQSLEEVAGLLTVYNNDSLINLNGLQGLQHSKGVAIDENGSLTSLEGLASLSTVGGGNLSIRENQALTDISSMDSVTEIQSNINIANNSSLPTCEALAFIQRMQALGWDHSFSVEGNAPDPDGGCDGYDEDAGVDLDADTDTDTDSDTETDTDPQCEGLGDFAFCSLDTTVEYGADLGYDICVGEYCMSPAICSTVGCNTPGPHSPAASDVSPSSYTRTEPVASQPIVEDSATGLVWQGCNAGLTSASCGTGTASALGWGAAVLYCDGLEWGGYSDWYLPDYHELVSIIDFDASSPSIVETAFPGTSDDLQHWTMTVHAQSSGIAWCCHFADGACNASFKTSALRVRCARRGEVELPDRFERTVVEGDPLVADYVSELAWQGCASGQIGDDCSSYVPYGYNWEDAVAYCDTLVWGGWSDWRLPTVKELTSLWRPRATVVADIAVSVFPNVPFGSFWTSTPYVYDGSDSALYVDHHDFSIAILVNYLHMEKTSAAFVRCVRDMP